MKLPDHLLIKLDNILLDHLSFDYKNCIKSISHRPNFLKQVLLLILDNAGCLPVVEFFYIVLLLL